MLPTREMADRLLAEGLLTSSTKDGLTIFKYARKVFYKNLWNEELELFRGTVFSGDKLLVMPLKKMYNYGERDTGLDLPLSTLVVADRKINGFMLTVSVITGRLLFSTTGSLDSPFVELGRDMFYHHTSGYQRDQMCAREGTSFVFEVVSEHDPHIVREDIGIHLLAMIENGKQLDIWTKYEFGCEFDFKVSIPTTYTLGTLLSDNNYLQHEGWVVYSSDGYGDPLFKLKTKYYLTTKFMMRSKKAGEAIFGDYEEAKEAFKDEEFFKCVEYIRKNYTKNDWDGWSDQGRREIIEEFFKGGAF